LHDETSTVDPLIRMAVAHYQFEAIHPFEDGNGRTGRVLNTLYLIFERLLDLPTLYLSRFFLQHRGDYYRLLLNVTKHQDWQAWVRLVLEGVEQTARWTVDLIGQMQALMRNTSHEVRNRAPRIWSRDLMDVVFTHPYCRVNNVVDATQVTRQTAVVHLRGLCDLGILREVKEGRSKLFINRPLMQLLMGRVSRRSAERSD
ncbi:MAG: Fic family protein, partial [Deltaproteobacteria bacterium]